ncbi:unnamed protein product [Trichobilharzia regenti]|nr:unnamed protein product [Trichobilharzia regenti]
MVQEVSHLFEAYVLISENRLTASVYDESKNKLHCEGLELNGQSIRVGNQQNRGDSDENSSNMPILRKELSEIASFSALVPSLKPSCIYRQIDDQNSSESNAPKLVKRYFDEFGFRIDDLGKSFSFMHSVFITHISFAT